MDEPIRILIAEDLPADVELAQYEIRKTLPGCVFTHVETREDFLAALESFQPDLIISDYHMPRFDGMTALKLALERAPLTPLIIWTGTLNEDVAVDCMKAGASNYVIKEHRKRLGPAILHALGEKQVRLERLRAEHALRESEERFRGLYENASIGIYRTTPQGCILMANPAAVRILGYDSFEELAQRNLERDGIEPPERRREFRERLERVGTLIGYESEWRKKDDSIIFVSENARVIRDQAGQVLYYDGTFEDITERKRAEEALRESEARYRARTEELEALFTLSTRLRQAQNADDMLPVILSEMRRVLNADGYEIKLLDATGEKLIVALSIGSVASKIGSAFEPDEGAAGQVLQTRAPYVTSDYSTDPYRIPHLPHVAQSGPSIVVPLHAENAVLGVLVATRRNSPDAHPFSQEQVRLLAAIGEMAGSALRRARLFDDTQRHLRRTEALHNVQLSVASSFDLRHTLNVALAHALTQLGVDAAAVLLLNVHTLSLDYVAERGFRTSSRERSRVPLGGGYAGRAALERQKVRIANLDQMEREFAQSPMIATEGFVAYYNVPLIAKGQVKGVLEIFRRTPLHADPEWEAFFETLAGQIAIAIDNLTLFTNLEKINSQLMLAYDATIGGLSRALDLRDRETEGHTLRVVELTLQLAQAMGMSNAELVHVRRGALLHDVGKIGIPDAILLKTEKLTAEEWAIMRRHPQYAFDIFSSIDYLRPALDIPYCHHEKWDGTGYPRGLRGEEIPLAARLFSIVDVWDALTSERPYRPALSQEHALASIEEQTGKSFDPRIVKMFVDILRQRGE